MFNFLKWWNLLGLLLVTPICRGIGEGQAVNIPWDADRPATIEKLTGARLLAKAGDWDRAMTAYEALKLNSGQQLIEDRRSPMPPLRWYRRVADVVNEDLGAWPAEVLSDYEKRLAISEEEKLQKAKANLDVETLEALAQKYFCLSLGARALEILGNIYFTNGDFAGALRYYQPLLEKNGFRNTLLQHPHYGNTSAKVYAAEALSLLALGKAELAEQAFNKFRQKFPNPREEAFLGRGGGLVSSLRQALDDDHFFPKPNSDWTGAGGDQTGQKRLFLGDGQWHAYGEPIAIPSAPDFNLSSQSETPYLAGFQNRTFWINNGAAIVKIPLESPENLSGLFYRRKIGPNFSVEGTQINFDLSLNSESAFFTDEDSVTAVDTKSPEPAIRWRRKIEDLLIPEPGSRRSGLRAAFRGVPVIAAESVYVAVGQASAMPDTGANFKEASSFIFKLDAHTGQIRWKQRIEFQPREDFKQAPILSLTLSGGVLFFSDHRTSVGALNARDGSRIWILKYPSSPARPGNWRREVAAPIADFDRLFIAPADYNRVLAIDPISGKILWQSDAYESSELIHLLGTLKDGRVVISGLHVTVLDAITGKKSEQWPTADNPTMTPAGRGLIAQNQVIFPTGKGIYELVFGERGMTSERITDLRGGNLMLSENRLFSVREDAIFSYKKN